MIGVRAAERQKYMLFENAKVPEKDFSESTVFSGASLETKVFNVPSHWLNN